MVTPNSAYGTGTFKRHILLLATDNKVAVELEDDNHAFRLRLMHDDNQVTGLDIDAVRHPFNTCPEAVRQLQQRIRGLPLGTNEARLREKLGPSQNCTHMYDMALMAMAHTNDTSTALLYDMEVNDESDGVTIASVFCNNRLVHEWKISNHALLEPANYAGKPVMRGFYDWVSQTLTGQSREAAMVLQRAYFVAQSRRFNFYPAAQHPATSDGMPQGACYSYNTGVVERAFRTDGTIRSFSQAPENLLKFLP